MFASPTEPGGGMSEGAKAQEEDLCRRSDIFGFMWDQVHFSASKSLYPLVSLTHAHERDPNYHQKEINRMIHVPNVSVFRTAQSEGYAFLDEPFNVGMLISPAPNSPRFIKNGQATNYARQEDIDQMVKLIKTQLSIACREGYDTVILGAFGCGSFKNPTPAVAKLYHDIIDAHFKGAFKSIVFAILDDPVPMDPNRVVHNPTGNLMPFQRYFP